MIGEPIPFELQPQASLPGPSQERFEPLRPLPVGAHLNPSALLALTGALVGFIVGLTGVGGGALMTPALILLFGMAPRSAVGTDLFFASATKLFATAVHSRHRAVDWPVVRRLALGSLPAAALTLLAMSAWKALAARNALLLHVIGGALVLTALGLVFKERLHSLGRRWELLGRGSFQTPLTITLGVLLGVIVPLTSIGAGALGTTALLCLYPDRLDARRLVGTDLAHALPLALVAGLGHAFFGGVEWGRLGFLLLGSIPGALLGAALCQRAPQALLRWAIALLVAASALKLFQG